MSVPPNSVCLSLILIAAMGAVQIVTALDETATWDEPVHLAAGYSVWATGQYGFNPEHPALAKMLCALPLYLLYRPTFERNADQVTTGNLFLYRNTTSADTLLFTARLVNIALTLLFAGYLAWWTRRRFGPPASLLALALFAFDPNLIAHGRYVTTDLAATLFIFTTCTLWIEDLLEPRWYWLVLTGVSLGCAFSSKNSTLFLPPVLLAMGVVLRRHWKPVVRLVPAGLISIVVIAAVYWPEVRHANALPPLGPSLTRTGFTGPVLSFLADRLHAPAFSYLIGIDRVAEHGAAGHPSYLLGQVSDHGWWYYFPVAFAVKTPSMVLAALIVTFALIWRSRRRAILAVLLLPPFVYFGAAMSSHIDIGVRHVLPVYPFLYAAIGCVIMEQRWWKPAALAIVVLVAVESLAIYPDYLAFFNVLSGGPDAGPKYLLDSNLDWGQDYRKLGRYMRQHAIPKVCLGSFANVDFPHYGVTAEPIPPGANANNLDCVVAISATPLFGQYVGLERFAWLRALKPTAILGHSIYIYDLRKHPS